MFSVISSSCHDGSLICVGFPDPFSVLTVDGEQTKTTSVIKKTLNPYWNESFDVYRLLSSSSTDMQVWSRNPVLLLYRYSINESSRRRTRDFLASSMFGLAKFSISN